MSTTATAQNQGSSSSLSFTQGFLLGQFSVVVLIFAFIKFFIFGEAPSSDQASRVHRRGRSYSSSSHLALSSGNYSSTAKKRSSVLRTSPQLTTADILAKTYYNVNGHQPESVDWFNVLVAQTIAQLRNDAQQDNAILTSLNAVLNGPHKPDFLSDIRITEINLGEEFPIFSNCRVIPIESDSVEGAGGSSRPSSSAGRASATDGGGRLQARMDVDLSDAITLGIETKLVLNYPKPLVAAMPVALAVSVIRFSGTLSISFIPSPSQSHQTPIPSQPQPQPPQSKAATIPTLSSPSSHPNHHPSSTSTRANTNSAHSHTHPQAQSQSQPHSRAPPTSLTFSFLPDYRLELSTRSLLGSRSRLQDLPKIAQLVESRLHAWFDERCVEPRLQQVVLPSFWPRRRNTVGGDVDMDADDTVKADDTKDPQTAGGAGESSTLLDDTRKAPMSAPAPAPAPTPLKSPSDFKTRRPGTDATLPATAATRDGITTGSTTDNINTSYEGGRYRMPGALPP